MATGQKEWLQVRRSGRFGGVTASFLLPLNHLVAGNIFRFVLTDLSDHFSRSMVKAPNFY